MPSFNINEFKFVLIGIKPGYDLFRYVVSCENFSMVFLLIGVDVTRFCDPLFNVDLVHFIWDFYRRFTFKKYAITVIPTSTTPRMLCLQYYRTKSDGWKDNGRCDDCEMENQLTLLPLTDCRQTDKCSCNICARQPPSLIHLATHVLLNYTVSLKRFELNEEITYRQYVYACRSHKVLVSKRIPPEFTAVHLWFRSEQDSPFRFHRNCPGSGEWEYQARDYKSYEDILSDLIRFKDTFWCHRCERGLFFPKT
jgi:hypothetical protein